MQRWLPLGLILALAAGAAVLLLRPGSKPVDTPKIEPSQANPAQASPSEAQAKPDFEKFKGRWVRTDGDYTVEVRSIDNDGKMDAGYFNPQPIKVAKAEVSQDGATTKVFIELRDVNYPGCTYNLKYDAQNDALYGVYYQAAMEQNFDVIFVRTK
jgi:hypothetical protein